MRPVGLIHQNRHISGMGQRRHRRQIKRHAVIIGIDDENRLGRWMIRQRLRHGFCRDPQGDPQPFIHHRRQIDGNRSGENQALKDRPMDIPRQQHLIPRRKGRQHHGVNGPSGTVHHEVSRFSAVQIRCQRLRLGNAARRMMEVVQLFHERYIAPQSLGGDELPQPRMRP